MFLNHGYVALSIGGKPIFMGRSPNTEGGIIPGEVKRKPLVLEFVVFPGRKL